MGEEYVLPSGLAACEYYNEFTGASELRIPATAAKRNKALKEALEQLHKLQKQNHNLANKLLETIQENKRLQGV